MAFRNNKIIVHITPYYNDGWGYQENLLPKYQKQLGHEVYVITSNKSIAYSKEYTASIPISGEYNDDGVIIKRLKALKVRGSLIFLKNLYSEIEKINPDIIFHHGIVMPSLFTVITYKKKNKYINLFIDNHTDYNILTKSVLAQKFYYEIYKIYIKYNLKQIDKFFGVTPERSLFLKYFYKIPLSKIAFLPIGTDILHLGGKDKKSLSDSSINNEFTLVCGGKLDKSKNIIELIKLYDELKKNANIKLILFGQILSKDLEITLKNREDILFLGFLNPNQIFQLYKGSHLGIWLSQHTTLMEDAINAELPIFIPKYGTTYHLISNNVPYLTTDDTLQSTYNKVLSLIKDKELYKQLVNDTKDKKAELSYLKIAKASISINEDKDYSRILYNFQKDRDNISTTFQLNSKFLLK